MKAWYFTFNPRSPDRSHFVRVEAANVQRACGEAIEAIGTAWTDVYNEAEFHVERIRRGLTEIAFADVLPWTDRGRNRANYFAVLFDADTVWITDLRGALPVTMDVERVVAELAAQHGERRILCYGCDGQWCELLHSGARFTGYKCADDLALAAA